MVILTEMRIAVYDLNRYYLLMKEVSEKGKLRDEFTIDHLKITLPNIKFTGPILQKMRIRGFLNKVGRPGMLTIYSLSEKHTHFNNKNHIEKIKTRVR